MSRFWAGNFLWDGGVTGVSPVRKGRPQRSAGEGKAFPFLKVKFFFRYSLILGWDSNLYLICYGKKRKKILKLIN